MILTGIGTGPQASVAPGVATALTLSPLGTPAPANLVIDPAGNAYFVTWSSNQVFKLPAATQTVSVIAGTTTAGYSGDGGLAVNAQLNRPVSLALDSSGNLFVADRNNHVIRKIDLATGIISTAVGTGVPGRDETGPALAAAISYPFALTADPAGNLYLLEGTEYSSVSDYKVRKVDAMSQTLSLFAGTGVAGNTGDGGPATQAQVEPLQLASDTNGNIYILQQSGSYIDSGGIVRVVSNGIISRFAGADAGTTDDGAPALSTFFYDIRNLVFDAANNAYFTSGATVIRKISPLGSHVVSNIFQPSEVNYLPEYMAMNADGSFLISDGFSGAKKVATQAAPLSFGPVNAGKSGTPLQLTYYNTGNQALVISDIAIGGINATDYVQTNDCSATLAPGGSCTISVTFTPHAMGASAGTLTITDNAPDSPRIGSLSGTGLTPQQAVLAPNSLTFGPQNGGTVSAAQTVTLSNPGIAPLHISAISVTNPSFAFTHNCPVSLAAGTQCTISVTFSPGITRRRAASL